MIILTGDIHGDITRLLNIQEEKELTKEDYIIVAGDFGMIWNINTYQENLKKIKKYVKAKVLFVDGNHENFNLLEQFPICSFADNLAQKINDQVYRLLRGRVYKIESKTIFTFGGAKSIDRQYRILNESWWLQEEPTETEIGYGEASLIRDLDKIDYVVTHDCPDFATYKMFHIFPRDPDYLLPKQFEYWYELIKDGKNFKQWFFGHMHVDMQIHDDLRGLFRDYVIL